MLRSTVYRNTFDEFLSYPFAMFRKMYCIRTFQKVFFKQMLSVKLQHSIPNRKRFLLSVYVRSVKVRDLKTSCAFHEKLFSEGENAFARKVLQEIPQYKETLLIPKLDCEPVNTNEFHRLIHSDWNAETPEKMLEKFERISNYCSSNSLLMTDTMFDEMCQTLAVKSGEMSDSQLHSVLACLLKWPLTESVNSRNFSSLWKALDKECVQRIKNWDLNKLLYTADHWYLLYLTRLCDYVWHSNWKLGRKPSRLTPPQLVQTIFYMNARRRIHPAVSMFEFEYSFEKCIDNLSIGEIAIIAMGFFKTETKVRSPNLLYKILERVMNEVNTIPDIPLSAILKILRYSIKPNLGDVLYELLNKLMPQVERLSLLTCIHVALVGSNILLFHENILNKIAQRYSKAIKQARIKDLERLAFILTLFDHDPQTEPGIFQQIVAEFNSSERTEEFTKHPRCALHCLYFLTLRNIILEHEISKVLDPEYILNLYGKNMFKIDRDILCLDTIVAIECPEYNGHRLDRKTRGYLAKKYTLSVPQQKKAMSATNRMFVEVMDVLNNLLGGEQYFYTGIILPHFERPDIVFFISSDGKPVEIPKQFQDSKSGDVKYAPPVAETGRWYCIVVGGWNTYIRNNHKLLGSTVSKIRHLEIVGYSPILIPWFNWLNVAASARGRYIQDMIEGAHKS